MPIPHAVLFIVCSSRVDPLLAEPFEEALKHQSAGPVLSKAASVECISPISPGAPDAKMLEGLTAEPWYQGDMSRKEAEGLLRRDGDFLVRKSTTNPGSFVLTGMHDGQAKHLLLVDPEGMVSMEPPVFHYPPVPAEVRTATPQGPRAQPRGRMLSGQSWATGVQVRAPCKLQNLGNHQGPG